MAADALVRQINDGGYDAVLARLYGSHRVAAQRARYARAVEGFVAEFGDGERPLALYSAPGRTELGGNHTDHNNGRVMAAAIDLDIIAVVAKTPGTMVRVKSEGFPKDEVDSADLLPNMSEFGRSSGIIRGVLAGITERGGTVGGFDAYTTSDVLKGSGLSSSAAFEVCLGAIVNGEFCDGRFSPVELGMVGQYAENVFFGKPSGLMDQLACAVGGAITIDFKDVDSPVVRQVPFDLAGFGHQLVITDTKGDHANLTGDYAAIRAEMESVAAFFGQQVLRQVPEEAFLAQLPQVRAKVGDRAVLRALHYYGENRRVGQLAAALEKKDFDEYCRVVVESGHSSFECNQNAYSPGDLQHQEIPIALALSQQVLGRQGAWRLQGGGFAGTIQAFVPMPLLDAYTTQLGAVFGADACHALTVRAVGCTAVRPE